MRSKEDWAEEILAKLKTEKFASPEEAKKFIEDIVERIQKNVTGEDRLHDAV